MTNEYRITVGGRYLMNGALISCPECGQAAGLTFTTPPAGPEVTASCSNGHVWREYRAYAEGIREAIRGMNRGRP